MALEQVAVDRLQVLADPSCPGVALREEVARELIESVLQRVRLALEQRPRPTSFDLARAHRTTLCREAHEHEMAEIGDPA